MSKEILFDSNDRIAVIAPHPDDECLGAAAALIYAADQTDIFVMTDGSHGKGQSNIEEEAAVRKAQFEKEMEYVKPRSWHWLGYEDTRLSDYDHAADGIDFTVYTKIFLPWIESKHIDHRAAARMCCDTIQKQKASAECFSYEINAPFRVPTHYIDITDVMEEKRKLIRFHADQIEEEPITTALNAFRAAQLKQPLKVKYIECYLKIDL